MKLERRNFLKTLGTGAVLTSLPGTRIAESAAAEDQLLHRDYQSNNPGTEYFLLGNGLIFAAVQTSANENAGTHCGLLLMSPEHFGRKISTYLYHPERGLQNSRCVVAHGGSSYAPEPGSAGARWEYPDGIPTVVIDWPAGNLKIREELWCPSDQAAVIRTISVTAPAGASDLRLTMLLYPNLMFFDEYDVDRVRGTLTASGYKTLRLFSSETVNPGDRHLTCPLGTLVPGATATATFVLTLDTTREEFERRPMSAVRDASRMYWNGLGSVTTGHKGLDHLYRVSTTGIRSAVARSGKMDGSIWQYNLEWVRDQSMVAMASAMAGMPEISGALLRRILSFSVDENGKTVDASRHRPPETIELDQNGELLYSLYTHWVWTGDDSIIREHWKRIRNVADYVLKPEFCDPSVGLVKNSREYWERDPAFGILEGYENSYQLWNIIGLEKAAQIARFMNDGGKSSEWESASARMKRAFTGHKRFSLVEDGRMVKRRLADGSVQKTMEPVNRNSMPKGMPLNVETVSFCDPDSSVALPIVFEVVDPRGSLAQKTLESLELLWNQRWKGGGYGRYHVTSEPDSPGSWPFASMFIARAYHEAGNHDKVWRTLNWLLEVQGASAGSWFEFYGERPSPPLPPVGLVVWNWAEIIAFFHHHLMGIRPGPSSLVVRPRLLTGLSNAEAKVRLRGRQVRIVVVRDKEQFATVNGKRHSLKDGALEIPVPGNDTHIEMHL